uniref:Uncharacterized protein n=1 Tax=Cucumis sativus TaxID=3659 RepID=A0A0A0LY47_CUCSA
MFLIANAASTLNRAAVPFSNANTTLVFNAKPGSGITGSRARTTNRVTFLKSSWIPFSRISSPYSSAARALAIAAVSRRLLRATCSAAPAVSSKASRAALRPSLVRVCSH